MAEYDQWRAVVPIKVNGTLAYNVGDFVPASNVAAYGYDTLGWVEETADFPGGTTLRLPLTYRGDFSEDESYTVSDVFAYEGASYRPLDNMEPGEFDAELVEPLAGTDVLTGTVAAGTYVPKWKASTSYTAGDKVLNPDGLIVSRITTGSSGVSYDPAQWTLVATTDSTLYPAMTSLSPGYPKWTPSTVYTTDSRVLNPTGAPIQSLTNRTSRASFDATEEAAWTAPAGYVRFSPGGINENIKGLGDGRLGLINWINNDNTAGTWLFHLTTTVNTSGGCIAIGIDGKGDGIFLRNKATGKGLRIQQLSSITSATAYGMAVDHESAVAPAVVFEQKDGADAALLKLIGYDTGTTARLLDVVARVGETGHIKGGTGVLRWVRKIEAQGGIDLRTYNNVVADDNTDHVTLDGTGIGFQKTSGTANVFYPSKIAQSSTQLLFQIGNTSGLGVYGGLETVIALGNGSAGNKRLGFFGTTPITKRAATADATDLASVIALANALKADAVAYGLKAA